jgi:hypothetical protein
MAGLAPPRRPSRPRRARIGRDAIQPRLREADGDWLDVRDDVDDGPPPLRTSVSVEKAKSIIAWNRSPDIGFDRSINPYCGCEQSHTVAQLVSRQSRSVKQRARAR